MGKKEWSNELTEKMIVMYRERPSLWKLNHVDYVNKNVRNKAYREIVEEVRKTIPEADLVLLKAKIQNLRTCFRKEQKKVEASQQSGAEEIYEPTLWYYELLSFLKQQDTPLLQVSNQPGNSERSPQSSESQSEMSYADANIDDSEVEETYEDRKDDIKRRLYFREPQQPTAKRNKKARLVEPTTTEFSKPRTSTLPAQTENEDSTIAGKYFAQKLKQMSGTQQIWAEALIQQVLSKGLRNQLTETTVLLDRASFDLPEHFLE